MHAVSVHIEHKPACQFVHRFSSSLNASVHVQMFSSSLSTGLHVHSCMLECAFKMTKCDAEMSVRDTVNMHSVCFCRFSTVF